jgi:hypothetical protein
VGVQHGHHSHDAPDCFERAGAGGREQSNEERYPGR